MQLPSPPHSVPHLTFFGDSSSREKEFMVAGGFAIAGHRIHEIETYIGRLKAEHGMRSEFHWSNYRGGQRSAAYEALVDYAFDLIRKRNAALHVIIVPFKGYKHNIREGENRDTSVNRMYYQLCLHRLARFYGKRRAIHIRLDQGNDSSDICNMRNQLCADAYRIHNTLPNCIRSIEPVSSENVGLIQMADVVMGAIAAKQNRVEHT